MCRRLLASVAREEGGLDRHEVLHQQVSLLKFGQTGKTKNLFLKKDTKAMSYLMRLWEGSLSYISLKWVCFFPVVSVGV